MYLKTFTVVVFLCLLGSQCLAAEISEAFGYGLGEKLNEEDVITRRDGIGPHDISPKKKARTVKKVQAYTTPDENLIFMIDGINTFVSMGDCLRKLQTTLPPRGASVRC